MVIIPWMCVVQLGLFSHSNWGKRKKMSPGIKAGSENVNLTFWPVLLCKLTFIENISVAGVMEDEDRWAKDAVTLSSACHSFQVTTKVSGKKCDMLIFTGI